MDVLGGTDRKMRSIYSSRMRYIALIALVGILLAACSSALNLDEQPVLSTDAPAAATDASQPAESSTDAPAAGIESSQPPTDPTLSDSETGEESVRPPDPTVLNRRVSDFDAHVPPRLIGPDGIRPVYNPRFVPADDAPLNDDELVIGIAIEGEAKAYPITVLRFREMVNDELGELPILVTW